MTENADVKNLFPPIGTDAWETFTPKTNNIAKFRKDVDNQCLIITIDSDRYGMGKWIAKAEAKAGKTYCITACVKTRAKLDDVYAIMTIYSDSGEMIIREHLEKYECTNDGYAFSHTAAVPDGGCAIELELWLKGYREDAEWKNIVLKECEPEAERKAKIALAYIAPDCIKEPTIEKNVAMIVKAVDNAGAKNPDIIVLSEAMYERGVPGTCLKETAETDTGTMCTLLRRKAKEYNSYLIYNFHEVDDEGYYNTSILFDRMGETVGKYRKTQLTIGEFEGGMTPGTETPVFDTDFGKIGMLICFDHYFPHTAELLTRKGAEIIFISSAGDAEEKLSARAMDNGIYMAVCGWNMENSHGWGPARVVAPDGSILADSMENTVPAYCEIDLSKRVRRRWLSLGPTDSEFKGVYLYEKNPDIN